MKYLDPVTLKAMDAIASIERSARVSASLGPEYGVTMSPDEVREFCASARGVIAHSRAASVVERSLRLRFGFFWFVAGLIVEAVLR